MFKRFKYWLDRVYIDIMYGINVKNCNGNCLMCKYYQDCKDSPDTNSIK